MSISFIFILILINTILVYVKKLKKALIASLLTLACFFAVGTGFVPNILLNHLQSSSLTTTDPGWKARNVIILLGAGYIQKPISHETEPSIFAFSRINKAARLFHACRQQKKICTLLISGGDILNTGNSEALIYQKSLIQLGIPSADILLEPKSMNTFQNAAFSTLITNQIKPDQIILVTSALHMPRSMLYFGYFNHQNIKLIPAAADFQLFPLSLLPMSHHFVSMDLALHEYLGLVRFNLYQFFGVKQKLGQAGTP